MANPTKYTQGYDFSSYEASNPSSPLPGVRVDIELAAIEQSSRETVDALADVRRSDGALANGIVTLDSLSPSLSIGFTNRGGWLEGESYSTGDGVAQNGYFYSARSSHTATLANAPVDGASNDTWLYLFSLSSITIGDGTIAPVNLVGSQGTAFHAKLETATVLGPTIAALTGKATPADGDTLPLADSGASSATKNLTWTNLKSAVFTALGELIAASTGKTTPADADTLALSDSAASGATKNLTWANAKATLKTYFDGLYTTAAAVAAAYQPLHARLTSLAGLAFASGDLIYATASTTLARLPKGTNGHILTLASGLPSWAAAPSSGQPVPTSSTFAVGALALCSYESAADLADGATTAGSNLRLAVAKGSFVGAVGAVQAGTWKNVSGGTLATDLSANTGYFVRTA